MKLFYEHTSRSWIQTTRINGSKLQKDSINMLGCNAAHTVEPVLQAQSLLDRQRLCDVLVTAQTWEQIQLVGSNEY